MARMGERTLLLLVGAVQFVNILDFMMVMPLGPDFARELAIPASSLGLVGGAYTASAAVAGLAGTAFLDRFDRRSALSIAMLGLVVATAAGGLATGLGTMLAARVAAGAFGGPATSLAVSIVADAVPAERRGKALGAVMGAFSVASVLGVPAGLELARLGSWRTPFFSVAAMGLLLAGAALFLMPPMRAHLDRAAPGVPAAPATPYLRRPAALLSLAATASTMMAGFTVVPNIAAHLQLNLGYPRERLGLLYMVGGALSFLVLRVAGRWVDRAGSARVAAAGTALLLSVLALGFAWPQPWMPVLPLFVVFMASMSIRNVSNQTLSSQVPAPAERARFLSAQSAVAHVASATGAGLSTRLLHVLPDGRLGGMDRLAAVSATLALLLPVLLAAARRAMERERGAG